MSEGENPNNYGFDVDDEKLFEIKGNIDMLMDGNEKRGWRMQDYRPYYWVNIQNNFQKNQDDLQVSDAVNWILDYEFS